MTQAETESADDADTDDEQIAWASQTPTTRLKGTPTGLIYAGRLDDSVEQNGTSFGLVLKDVEVVSGTLWVNQQKPDDSSVEGVVDEDSTVPTDYRIADADDADASFDRDGNFKSDEESTVDGEPANTYEEADSDAVPDDEIIVWYNGMSGERLSRVLDFNGRPFAEWKDTDDDYLMKGLYQVAEGWRDADSSERSDMKNSGKAPRVVRAPILRQRVDIEHNDDGNVESAELLDEPVEQEILVDVSRFQGGRAYEMHVFDAGEFADEFDSHSAELPRNDDGFTEDIESELDMAYTSGADEILEQAEYAMHMFTGEGWQDEPESWTPQSTAEVSSFGITADAGDDSGFTPAQEQFISEITDAVRGTGLTPDEVFDGGVEGVVGKYGDQLDTVPDIETIREEVYDRVAHLDTAELTDS